MGRATKQEALVDIVPQAVQVTRVERGKEEALVTATVLGTLSQAVWDTKVERAKEEDLNIAVAGILLQVTWVIYAETAKEVMVVGMMGNTVDMEVGDTGGLLVIIVAVIKRQRLNF